MTAPAPGKILARIVGLIGAEDGPAVAARGADMRLAVVSDLHLGDESNSLVDAHGVTPVFRRLVELAGTDNDFLVLLGDALDFSVASYSQAYTQAKVFFTALKAAGVAEQLLFIPGNHDGSMWHIIRHEANIIRQIRQHQDPVERWTVPAVLDTRSSLDPLTLVGVKPNASGPRYGGLFLDELAGTAVSVAYPNLYVIDPDGSTTLLTHGHYFEPYWSLPLNLARQILREDLDLGGATRPDIEDIVTVNFPLNELASSGLGQAGHLTPAIRQIQVDAKAGRLDRIEVYLARARDLLDEKLAFNGFFWFVKELASDIGLDRAKACALKALGDAKESIVARGNETFLTVREVIENVRTYLDAVALERQQMRDGAEVDVPDLSRVVFGHTHLPIHIGDPKAPSLAVAGHTVSFHNTGGWLQPGVEAGSGVVFTYDSSAPAGMRWTSS